MIQEFVDKFMENRHLLIEKYSEKAPESYLEMVQDVIGLMETDSGPTPDAGRIIETDQGDYQGNLLYIIHSKNSYSHTVWHVRVSYGSCSGCDTLQSIRSHNYSDTPTESEIKDYLTLALHIVQAIKELEYSNVDMGT